MATVGVFVHFALYTKNLVLALGEHQSALGAMAKVNLAEVLIVSEIFAAKLSVFGFLVRLEA